MPLQDLKVYLSVHFCFDDSILKSVISWTSMQLLVYAHSLQNKVEGHDEIAKGYLFWLVGKNVQIEGY